MYLCIYMPEVVKVTLFFLLPPLKQCQSTRPCRSWSSPSCAVFSPWSSSPLASPSASSRGARWRWRSPTSTSTRKRRGTLMRTGHSSRTSGTQSCARAPGVAALERRSLSYPMNQWQRSSKPCGCRVAAILGVKREQFQLLGDFIGIMSNVLTCLEKYVVYVALM